MGDGKTTSKVVCFRESVSSPIFALGGCNRTCNFGTHTTSTARMQFRTAIYGNACNFVQLYSNGCKTDKLDVCWHVRRRFSIGQLRCIAVVVKCPSCFIAPHAQLHFLSWQASIKSVQYCRLVTLAGPQQYISAGHESCGMWPPCTASCENNVIWLLIVMKGVAYFPQEQFPFIFIVEFIMRMLCKMYYWTWLSMSPMALFSLFIKKKKT